MKYHYVFLIAVLLCACKSNNSGSGAGKGAVEGPAPIGPAAEEDGAPIPCKSDADCPRRSCGPCTPGAVLMNNRMLSVSCTVNPCTNSRSICGPQGLCIIHPNTAMAESLQSVECRNLIRDKWRLLCKGKTGEAATACEDIVDAATAKDDAAGCEAARDRLTD